MIKYSCTYVTRYYLMRDKIGKYIVNLSFWMTSNSRCKIYGIKELESSESKKSFAG